MKRSHRCYADMSYNTFHIQFIKLKFHLKIFFQSRYLAFSCPFCTHSGYKIHTKSILAGGENCLVCGFFQNNFHCVKNVQIRSFFWSLFSCIWTEYRKIRTRKNTVFGHFSRSGILKLLWLLRGTYWKYTH